MIIRFDRNKKIRFTDLRSSYATAVSKEYGDLPDYLDSIAFLDHDQIYYKSDAVLRIARRTGGIFYLLLPAYLFPHNWRDKIYDYIASNRYTWFGRKQECDVPASEIRDRFLL